LATWETCCNVRTIILTTRYEITSWHPRYLRFRRIDCNAAKGETGEEEERKAQWRVPRVHDTRECVFSLVTVTRDALARCIGPMQRPYETTLRSERRAYVISACRETAFRYLSCKEHVREVRANKRECLCAGGKRGKRDK